MFKCSKCGRKHQRYREPARLRPASYCTACHAAYMRSTRPKHSQLTDEQRTKANCRSRANVAQHRGTIVPRGCEVCGAPAEKHHEDYSKPLEIKWLCRPCHLTLHRETRPA